MLCWSKTTMLNIDVWPRWKIIHYVVNMIYQSQFDDNVHFTGEYDNEIEWIQHKWTERKLQTSKLFPFRVCANRQSLWTKKETARDRKCATGYITSISRVLIRSSLLFPFSFLWSWTAGELVEIDTESNRNYPIKQRCNHSKCCNLFEPFENINK